VEIQHAQKSFKLIHLFGRRLMSFFLLKFRAIFKLNLFFLQQKGNNWHSKTWIILEFSQVGAVFILCPDCHLNEAKQGEQPHWKEGRKRYVSLPD